MNKGHKHKLLFDLERTWKELTKTKGMYSEDQENKKERDQGELTLNKKGERGTTNRRVFKEGRATPVERGIDRLSSDLYRGIFYPVQEGSSHSLQDDYSVFSSSLQDGYSLPLITQEFIADIFKPRHSQLLTFTVDRVALCEHPGKKVARNG